MLSPEQEAEIRRDVAFTKGDRHWRYQGEAAWGVTGWRMLEAHQVDDHTPYLLGSDGGRMGDEPPSK